MKIITVQHTQAVHHKNGMVGGSTDWSLTARGKRHARRIARKLRRELGKQPDYVLYASDMLRTSQTAAPIAKALHLPVTYVPELRELKMGSATGQSKQWLKEHSAPREGSTFLDYRPIPDAETRRELSRRIAVFVKQLESEEKNAIVVAHGGSLAAFVPLFLHIPEEMTEQIWFVGRPGSLHRLEQSHDRGRIVYALQKLNETL